MNQLSNRYLSCGQWAVRWKMPIAKAGAVIRKAVANGKMVMLIERCHDVEVPVFAMSVGEAAR